MRRFAVVTSILMMLIPMEGSAADLAMYTAPEEIPYDFYMSDGPSVRMRDGATVYKNKPRGYVDSEPMTEVIPVDRPYVPPKVDVIPYPEMADLGRGVVSDTRRKVLKGEDKIFEMINQDVVKARCFLLGEDCDQTPEFKKRREMLYPPVDAPSIDLDVQTSRRQVRREELRQ